MDTWGHMGCLIAFGESIGHIWTFLAGPDTNHVVNLIWRYLLEHRPLEGKSRARLAHRKLERPQRCEQAQALHRVNPGAPGNFGVRFDCHDDVPPRSNRAG